MWDVCYCGVVVVYEVWGEYSVIKFFFVVVFLWDLCLVNEYGVVVVVEFVGGNVECVVEEVLCN